MRYEKRFVWSLLLRLYHWSLAGSIVALVITGLYINNPWSQTNLEGGGFMTVLAMRNIHGLAGYLFTAAILVRIFLLFFGNRQERLWDFLPLTGRNVRNLGETIGVYTYLRAEPGEDKLGHNVLAGLTYTLTIIAALFQMASGFYLRLPENAFWQKWGVTLFASQQNARFIHHLLLWYFILFALIHIYLVVWNDLKHPDGLISSIFTGHKFKPSRTE